MAPREWDASTYDALPLPHLRWGQGVIERLPLDGDETVLDAGAGTGRDTLLLLERLPRGHVIAVDASTNMLAQLRARLAGVDPERLSILHADLMQPLRIDRPVDAITSVATLHWLTDHDAVFASFASVLRPGGLLRAEWGGHGNLARLESVLTEMGLPTIGGLLNFPTAEETAERLIRAGFTEVDVRLVEDPARLQAGPQLESFLGTVVLGALLDPLPAEERAPLVREIARRLPVPEVDYVRVQADARLAG